MNTQPQPLGRIPSLGELLARFVQRHAAQAPVVITEATSEVVPFQASPLLAVDAKLAFEDAMEAAGLLLGSEDHSLFQARKLKQPPDWAALVRNQTSVVTLPFCLGSFPQMVRDVSTLLNGPEALKQSAKESIHHDVPGLHPWAEQMLSKGKLPEALFAAAALRLAGQLEAARQIFDQVRGSAPRSWHGLLLNEEAALVWQSGDVAAAAEKWAKHPDQNAAPVQFNKGLCALMDGGAKEAVSLFTLAANKLPETSPWHHLARLYLTLAELS